jgi:Flp pilus assembly protein TadG
MIPLLKKQNGSAMILLTLILTALIGFTALITDVGNVMVEKQKMQNAIDAASIAAAQELPDASRARDVANEYIQLNGYQPSDIEVTFSEDNNSIQISGTRVVNFYFAKLLGKNNTTIRPSATAECGSMGGAFDYVLFSGSKTTQLVLNGSNQTIQGSSHTNKNFIANGSKIAISGSCEAMGTITINGSQNSVGSRVPNASFVEMPDFSEALKLQAEQAGQAYTGSKTYCGSNISVDSPIYVDGNLTVNGSHFKGKGSVLVTGNITFNGSNLNQSSDDAVCFYSKRGNITVNGSNSTFDGILYAPGGSIIMNGSNQTVNGRVIGNTVTINGSNLSILGGSNELNSLPSHSVRLIR